MLYIPKIYDYLKIFIDNEVKDVVVKNFDEYFKSTKEKCYYKLCEKQKIRTMLYIYLTKPNEVEKYPKNDEIKIFS